MYGVVFSLKMCSSGIKAEEQQLQAGYFQGLNDSTSNNSPVFSD